MDSSQSETSTTPLKEMSHEKEGSCTETLSPEEITAHRDESVAQAQVIALQKELATARDEVLRAYADLDNMRKRNVREQEETRKYAVTHFARDILSVSDNLERAMASFPTDMENPQTKTVIEGILFVQKELETLLSRHQIQKIKALYEKFDPHCHQAMLENETDEHIPGTVVQVLQEGYMIADRLLRPALVGVSKANASPVEKLHPNT